MNSNILTYAIITLFYKRYLKIKLKRKKLPHPPLVFNNANVTQSIYQKHLGITLDPKLTFKNHINGDY